MMDEQRYDTGLAPEANERLDRALAKWAVAHALSPAQSESVRQAVMVPAELGYAWWQNWLNQLSEMVAKPRGAGFSQFGASSVEGPVVNAWQIRREEFVPYLRVG
jgi:uncharacterized protein YeaC (DUF1315 family)